ncbi:hypothetical protein [Serratia fonticola]|uniref:hypothetical protein n=1 Tax=Serratia fonticola TaxID=47917 RepID=UPI0021785D19|nr:hypothetical protein [Serratia fonticola]CAI0765421.1 Uncharacterised protein [Serratia fonticola]CAI0766320.1 Uncharacterised protein [Serratia fonticola]
MTEVFIIMGAAKVVAESESIWKPVLPALAGGLLAGGITLAGIWLTHYFARKREQEAAERKIAADRYFIATELVFKLEDFAEACASASEDDGEPDKSGYWRTTTQVKPLEFDDITGDWRALPDYIMYRVLEFHVLQPEASGAMTHAYDHDSPPDYSWYFRERRYQYARLGLRALFLAKRLRKITGMPSSRLDKYLWSPQKMLWQCWRKERKFRNKLRREEE